MSQPENEDEIPGLRRIDLRPAPGKDALDVTIFVARPRKPDLRVSVGEWHCQGLITIADQWRDALAAEQSTELGVFLPFIIRDDCKGLPFLSDDQFTAARSEGHPIPLGDGEGPPRRLVAIPFRLSRHMLASLVNASLIECARRLGKVGSTGQTVFADGERRSPHAGPDVDMSQLGLLHMDEDGELFDPGELQS